MKVTRVLFLSCALEVFCGCGFSQTYLAVNFDQLPATTGCVRNAPTPTATPAIPPLKVPGATFSGGQVLNYNYPNGPYNNVYATISTCAGVQPSITITFDGPVSGLNMNLGTNWNSNETLQIVDDAGGSQTQSIFYNPYGVSIYFTNNNVHQVTLTLTSPAWTQGSPAGFYIDNISCYLNEPLYFFDPVPNLMSGGGVISDANTIATTGTLVRGVAADGMARVVLAAPTQHVGDVVAFSIAGNSGGPNSSQDGGITDINGSSNGKSPSVRVASQDTSNGPMAFALYYAPSDFSRGSQDEPLSSRAVVIQAATSGPSAATVSKRMIVVRPPVVLVHDLWGDPSDWNNFTPLLNDSRFFIRRASYNGVLGGQITASLPTYQTGGIALAKESSLGLAYNSPLLLTQLAQAVTEYRSIQNIAAARADVVVHGMGGDLARALVQMANYESPESYSQGTVNKLITIGTPHLGTPLAAALLRSDNACFREILADAGNFSFSNATVNNSSVSGGIGDLQGDGFGGGLSPALAQIQQRSDDNAPTALIAGITNNANSNGLGNPAGTAQFIRQMCSSSPLASDLTAAGWSAVFAFPNDAMVPLFSQLAGRLFGNSVSTIPGMVHSTGIGQLGFNPPGELDAAAPVITAVVNLLNTQVQSDAFQPLP